MDNHPPLRHRANPYADIPSLYDLYAQFSRRSVKLERFGEDIFRNGTGNFDDLPMDVPAGPDYVLGPGDGLNIELYGRSLPETTTTCGPPRAPCSTGSRLLYRHPEGT